MLIISLMFCQIKLLSSLKNFLEEKFVCVDLLRLKWSIDDLESVYMSIKQSFGAVSNAVKIAIDSALYDDGHLSMVAEKLYCGEDGSVCKKAQLIDTENLPGSFNEPSV